MDDFLLFSKECLPGRRREEPHVGNPTLLPPPDGDVHSDDDIICEVENYTEGVEGDAYVQAFNPPQLAFFSSCFVI